MTLLVFRWPLVSYVIFQVISVHFEQKLKIICSVFISFCILARRFYYIMQQYIYLGAEIGRQVLAWPLWDPGIQRPFPVPLSSAEMFNKINSGRCTFLALPPQKQCVCVCVWVYIHIYNVLIMIKRMHFDFEFYTLNLAMFITL